MKEWEKYIASMREEIPKRHKAVQEQLRGEFHLSSAAWDEIMTEAKKKAG